MVRAHVGTALIALLAAGIGTFIVLKGMSFIGDTIAHASFGGLALSVMAGLGWQAGAILFGVGTAVAVSVLRHLVGLKNDTALAILYTGAFALGVLGLSLIPSSAADLTSLLLGSVLAISPLDLWILLITACVVLGVLWLGFERFAFVAFDPSGARAAGIPVLLTDMILLALIALSIVVSLQAIGAILVVALFVTPATTAQLLVRRLEHIIPTAAFFALLATQGGLYFSYYLGTPAGAAIVLVATVQFALVWMLRQLALRLLRRRPQQNPRPV